MANYRFFFLWNSKGFSLIVLFFFPYMFFSPKIMDILVIYADEGFRDKTRNTPFLKSWNKGQKLLIFFLFIFIIIYIYSLWLPLVSTFLTWTIKQKLSVVGIIKIYCFNLSNENLQKWICLIFNFVTQPFRYCYRPQWQICVLLLLLWFSFLLTLHRNKRLASVWTD